MENLAHLDLEEKLDAKDLMDHLEILDQKVLQVTRDQLV